MNCPACQGSMEQSPNGMYRRCLACGQLYIFYNGALSKTEIPAGSDPQLFLQGVGFPSAGGPPPTPMEALKRAAVAQVPRPEDVHVKVKVGDVKLDLSTGGVGVDTSKLEKSLLKKVQDTVGGWIWSCAFAVVFIGIFACQFGGIAIYAAGHMQGWF